MVFRRVAHAAIPLLHRAGNAAPCRRWPNRVRKTFLPPLDRVARSRWNRPLVRDKSDADAEHVATIKADLCEFEQALHANGFERAVLSTLKRVDGRYEVAAWAHHADGWQTHVYVFRFGSDLHIYAHREPSYLSNPDAHEGGAQQTAGDPKDHLAPVYATLA